ncbi:MAG: hypothetical protein HY401_09150 [Elusimicrobia bacterium]|nr:hypothetical protein [Elusimicrobiota bacterium]
MADTQTLPDTAVAAAASDAPANAVRTESFVTPFVRTMPKQGHEEWMIKLHKMSVLLNRAEYETVKLGLRKAAVIHIDPQEFDTKLLQINSDNLVFTPILKSAYYVGYAHQHKTPQPGEPFYWYGALTKTREDGLLFKEAEDRHDHLAIGELLGYPACCTEYFKKSFPINYDPVWIDREGVVKGYPENNILLRYFGARMSTCINCSPACQAVREVGKRWFSVMKKLDPATADDLMQILSNPVKWDSYHGVVQVENAHLVCLTHTFPYIEKRRVILWQCQN